MPIPMFEKRRERGYRPALDGIERKTLVHSEETLMTEFRLRTGTVLPRHWCVPNPLNIEHSESSTPHPLLASETAPSPPLFARAALAQEVKPN